MIQIPSGIWNLNSNLRLVEFQIPANCDFTRTAHSIKVWLRLICQNRIQIPNSRSEFQISNSRCDLVSTRFESGHGPFAKFQNTVYLMYTAYTVCLIYTAYLIYTKSGWNLEFDDSQIRSQIPISRWNLNRSAAARLRCLIPWCGRDRRDAYKARAGTPLDTKMEKIDLSKGFLK